MAAKLPAGLYRRGCVIWYKFQFDGLAYRQSCDTGSVELAKLVRDEAFKAIVAQKHGIKQPQTLEWMATKWIEDHAAIFSKNYLRTAKIFFDLHIMPTLGKRLMTTIDNEILLDLRSKFSATHSNSTCNTLMKHIGILFNYAQQLGYLGKIPYSIKRLTVRKRSRPVIKVEEAKPFLEFVRLHHRNPQVYCMTALALFCGMREGEILSAQWKYLDTQALTYTIPGDTSKNKKSRVLDLPPFLLPALLELSRNLGSPYLFPSHAKGHVGNPHPRTYLTAILLGTKQKSRVVNTGRFGGKQTGKRVACEPYHIPGLLEKFGLPAMGAHRLRASFATMHHSQGTPLVDIQEMLGHANLSTTAIYIEKSTERQKDAQSKLAKIAGL